MEQLVAPMEVAAAEALHAAAREPKEILWVVVPRNEVVAIKYRDRDGRETRRDVEPVGVMAVDEDFAEPGPHLIEDDLDAFGPG